MSAGQTPITTQNVSLSDVLTYLRLGLAGATTLLAALKLKSDVPQEVIEAVEAAVTALEKVHGSDVVLAQLESLRISPQW